ncbi:peptidoglycan D,D-transpeptidase FtsI family protein [Maricaulis sp. MIT060901]|uniref:peptidoglycan D,D-transpeptidase FtsI family protein n=1 Tax=Maricaulis sp. MIT060901 TaxID=3096993 RepID=UPI00399A8DE4
MKLWPFRRSVSTETVNPALPPLAEAAPADMSRLLRVESDEVQALEQARSRLRMLGLAVAVGFGLLALRSIEMAVAHPSDPLAGVNADIASVGRGEIFDRTGQVLATTLETHSLYADPTQVWDAAETAEALSGVLPGLDTERVIRDLSSRRRFVWIQRNLTPRQRQAVFALGLPGVGFRSEPRRVYPRGRLASHVVGYTDRDMAGLAGAERAFNSALSSGDGRPVALSIDMAVQFHLDEVLRASMIEFDALAASGIVMNVRTGEIVGMVSLPDFDPNRPMESEPGERLNRSAQSVYEMGSTFKAFTVALALETETATLESGYDASNPLQLGGHTINDYHAEDRWLTLSEVFTHSSNIGSSLIALEAGSDAQRGFLGDLRLLERAPIELIESADPLLPRQWAQTETATISYGHGIAVSPIATIAAFAAIANDGVYVPPTLQPVAANETLVGERVMSSDSARDVLALMRENVTDGTGGSAEAQGYRVAGKTGTAEKPHRGGYDSSRLISSFSAVFPYDDPQYAVLVLLDEPQGNESTYGYATGGWTAAPATGEIISRIAPILGVERSNEDHDSRAALVRAALMPEDIP